jgi:hypothetical protein
MRKLITGGLFVAGMVFLPVSASLSQARRVEPSDYRNDPRLKTLRDFFRKFDCPAARYSEAFLEAADAYALDWRLLPSLSIVESSGGKSARNNNLFGWDSGRAHFPNPIAGIHAVGYRLAHSIQYRHKELDKVLATYNPNIEYAQRVKSVMRRISPSE